VSVATDYRAYLAAADRVIDTFRERWPGELMAEPLLAAILAERDNDTVLDLAYKAAWWVAGRGRWSATRC
jgi:hypothetical protein